MFPGLSFSAQVVHGNLASEGSPVSSSTGTSDTMKNASNTDKRITNEKKNGTRKVPFVRRVIDGSSMSNR